MAFSFDQIFAADPANPQNVASNASVLIYAPGDATKTPLTITDPSGSPLSNPVTVNANGFGSAFMHETLDRVAWDGGGFTGFFTSYEGMKNVAVAAQEAAEAAGSTAAEAAAAGVASVVADADAAATAAAASATAAANAAALVGAPADSAIAAAVNGSATATKAALNATYASKANAVNPDDVGYDVILLAGQSNMMGQASGYDTAKIDLTDPRIFQYGNTGTYANTISLAVDPLAHHQVNGMGPGLTFARWYLNTIPNNRRVLLVPTAHGGTAFEGPDSAGGSLTWKTTAPVDANNLYENAITQTLAAIAAGGAGSRLVAILWLQGESDAINGTTGATYQADLDALIDGFRTRLSAPDVPFVLGQMLPETIAANSAYAAIDAVHVDTPKRKLRTAYSYGAAGQNNGDGLHYNAAGQRTNARRFFDALTLARANVLGTPPLPVSGLTLTQSGTAVTAAWTRPASRFTSFTVEYRQGAGAWNTVTRTLPMGAAQLISGLTLGSAYEVRVSTVNEAGTSAPVTASLTLLNVPGQVTGLTAGTPTSTSVPLTWTATSGATSYLVEYKTSASSTWLQFATKPTAASLTVTGLTAATDYNFRVSAINAGGTGTASTTANATTVALPFMLADVPVTPYAAFSLRKLKSTYAGSAIRVRRSSDNTEQDIGFVSNQLDTAALLTFAGSGSAYVKTWYDQSGSARDVTQATAASQPRIVNAGTVDTLNGLPTVVFDGTASNLQLAAAGLYAAGAATVMAVSQGPAQNAAGTRLLIEADGASTNGSLYSPLGTSTAQLFVQVRNTTPANVIALGSSNGNPFNGSGHVLTTVDTGSAVSTYVDATAGLSASAYTRGTMSLTKLGIGATPYSTVTQFFSGQVSEIIAWGSALSDANRVAGYGNEKSFYGTP